MARSYIRTSNIDYFPSLIKSNHFNDTVSDLTIFVDKKNIDGSIDNIFIKENFSRNKSKIVTAKKGILSKKRNDFYLILYNGKIINIDEKNTNLIKFDRSELNLSKFKTKTTTFPKIQETSTGKLINCVNYFANYNQSFEKDLFRCNENSINSVTQEIYKRIILPIYIIILGFTASFLIIKSKNQNNFNKYKIFIFILGFLFIVFSEGSTNLISYYDFSKSIIALTPILS
jgi:Predicted permeases